MKTTSKLTIILGLMIICNLPFTLAAAGGSTLRRTGSTTWEFSYKGRSRIDLVALPHLSAVETEKVYQDRKVRLVESVETARKRSDQATTPEDRRATRSQLDLYLHQLQDFTGSFTDWPMIALVDVSGGGENRNRVLAVCRSGKRDADIAVVLKSGEKLFHRAFLQAVKHLIEALDQMSDSERSGLGKANTGIFDAAANTTSQKNSRVCGILTQATQR